VQILCIHWSVIIKWVNRVLRRDGGHENRIDTGPSASDMRDKVYMKNDADVICRYIKKSNRAQNSPGVVKGTVRLKGMGNETNPQF